MGEGLEKTYRHGSDLGARKDTFITVHLFVVIIAPVSAAYRVSNVL